MQLEICTGSFNGDDGKGGGCIPGFRWFDAAEATKIEERIAAARLAAAGVYRDPFEVRIPGRPYKPRRYQITPPGFVRVPADPFNPFPRKPTERIEAVEEHDDLVEWSRKDREAYLEFARTEVTRSGWTDEPFVDPFRVTIPTEGARH